MGRADYFEPGGWNATCYFCGRKRKASQMRKQWQGYWVCKEEWEPRQPQDFVRGVEDKQAPPWAQPPQTDVFVQFCTPNGRTALPGFAEPGCVTPAHVDTSFDPSVST